MERYEIDRYGLDMTMSPPESEDEDSDDYPSDVVSLQKLLATAIKKRRELSITEGENLLCETLQTRLIIRLCKRVDEKMKKRLSMSGSCTTTYSSDSSSSEDDENDDDEEPPAKRRSLGEDGKEVE
ncbi:hypothetical protein L5515_009074 [Caenorhabditis briggsae]|uniref:Uncharacterized protein n=1 Tax=Caenorhabditis briggsae TaxID=6238 RepID=A0AAE9FAK1_CAEBR|nr:hypothetical protein L5515_009074 [Caenorhabditis briggsae]